ncbi:hypothetical protein ACR6C2_39845 [Streptomyces sp. INA 01156]
MHSVSLALTGPAGWRTKADSVPGARCSVGARSSGPRGERGFRRAPPPVPTS